MLKKKSSSCAERSVTELPSKERLKEILADYQLLPEYLEVNLRDANTMSSFGDRPLHTACTRGTLSDVEVLLAFGADINAKGEHGFTPLHQAVQHGHLDVVRILVDMGADLDANNDDGDSPEQLARCLDEVEIEEYLASLKGRRLG